MRRPVLLLLAIACGGPHPPPHTPGTCNPLIGDPHACLNPWPTSYFQVDDTTSATGFRNQIPTAAMPKNVGGKPIDPARLNRLDGFSPSTPLVLYFSQGVDPTGLATVNDFSPSLKPDAAIQLFDMTTGERIDSFAELDANATGMNDRQALIVRPQQRLKPGTKYAVAVLGLKAKDGSMIPAPDAFVQARDNLLTQTSALWTMKDRYDALFTFLGTQGLTRGQLTLAWDFMTASEDMITGRLVRMRDRALAAATFDYRVDLVQDFDAGSIARQIEGTFTSPSFLSSDAGTATLPADAGPDPAIIAQQPFPFAASIPRCAKTATGPLPIMIYGHGFLGSAANALAQDPSVADIGNQLCMVQVATNWLGLTSNDLTALATVVIPDFSRFPILTDRLMQAQVNTVVLTRLAAMKLKDDPAFKLGGTAVTDGSQLNYLGISLGGIEGTTFMALSPDIVRGVTNVAGGNWNLIMSRSGDFGTFSLLLKDHLPDKLDQQLAFAVVQSMFDETDPVSYAPHLLSNPLHGAMAKKILLQESEGDAEVPNLATRLLARTEGITGLSPAVTGVPGITDMAAPLDSAYVQFDTHPTPLPADTNVAAADNGAHDACHRLPVAIQQMQAFLKPDGAVQQFCSGSCDPD
jgi:hypothetical protein